MRVLAGALRYLVYFKDIEFGKYAVLGVIDIYGNLWVHSSLSIMYKEELKTGLLSLA